MHFIGVLRRIQGIFHLQNGGQLHGGKKPISTRGKPVSWEIWTLMWYSWPSVYGVTYVSHKGLMLSPVRLLLVQVEAAPASYPYGHTWSVLKRFVDGLALSPHLSMLDLSSKTFWMRPGQDRRKRGAYVSSIELHVSIRYRWYSVIYDVCSAVIREFNTDTHQWTRAYLFILKPWKYGASKLLVFMHIHEELEYNPIITQPMLCQSSFRSHILDPIVWNAHVQP